MTFADYERGLLSDSVAAVDTRLTAALAAQNADLVAKNTALEDRIAALESSPGGATH